MYTDAFAVTGAECDPRNLQHPDYCRKGGCSYVPYNDRGNIPLDGGTLVLLINSLLGDFTDAFVY